MIPNFQHDVLRFVTGNFGPFVPQTAVEVPLWLAVLLRKRRMCSVVPPDWLQGDALEAARAGEAGDAEAFGDVPFHYQEVAALLLGAAAEDLEAKCGVPSALSLREAVEDIAEQRAAKIREGLLAVAQQATHDETTYSVKMNRVSAMEIASMRPQLLLSLGEFYDARQPRAAAAGPGRDKRKASDAPRKNSAANAGEPAKRTLKRFKE